MATSQQLLTIASFILKNSSEYAWMKQVAESTPRNNEAHPDTRCNYQTVILSERLKELSVGEADYFIKAYKTVGKGYSVINSRNTIIKHLK